MCIKIDKILYVVFLYPKYTKWEGSMIKNQKFVVFKNTLILTFTSLYPWTIRIRLQNVNFLAGRHFPWLDINKILKMATIKTCFQKLLKMQSYITKHFKWCSVGNRDHCGNISVIFNIFWEQKYWWQVWLLRGTVSQWPVMYLWTGRANVRSGVLLDLGILPYYFHRIL